MRIGIASLALTALVATACGDAGKSLNSLFSDSNMKKASHGEPHGMFGAIFTTDSEGNAVNANIYENKEDVYLNGGPKKEGAAGLPEGDYYYLITDPGCKEQLAGPSAAAPYNTSGKIITVDENGEFTDLMQLAPFADTPNNGGEYKVYITSVENYTPGEGCFGFIPRFTKTDNFKVRESVPPPPPGEEFFCISGIKFFDRDGNGIPTSPEQPVNGGGDGQLGVGGIEIVLSSGGQDVATTTTGSNGAWSFCGLEPGDYEVREELPDEGFWEQTFPENNAPHQVTLVDEDVTGLLFGNICHVGSAEGPVPEDPEDCGVAEQVE